MNEFQTERLCRAFEHIAESLEGINEQGKQFYSKLFPERIRGGDAIVTRVPTEEDKIREAQGAGDRRPIREWLGGIDEDSVGDNERRWLAARRRKAASSKTQGAAGTPESGPEAPADKE